MNLLHHYSRWLIGIIALIAVMSVSGCSGITPDGNLRNNREEGPEKGLFSGPDGEFVIVAPAPAVTDDNTKSEEPVKSQE